jgi:hypothetical protein
MKTITVRLCQRPRLQNQCWSTQSAFVPTSFTPSVERLKATQSKTGSRRKPSCYTATSHSTTAEHLYKEIDR